MTNRQLISEFEQGRAPGEFHHADHVRVAFAYVSELPLLEAIAKFSAALGRFALARGKPNLYHETITWAYLFLIAERVGAIGRAVGWEEFSERNPDLLLWKGGVLERYYSKTTLDSDRARRHFVLPDCGL
jgi:TM2 domain-containing membrane protein YozV